MGRPRTNAGVAALMLLGVSACGGGDRGSEPSAVTTVASPAPTTTAITNVLDGRLPVVVDTDLAADDIVALSYLASHPRVQLMAVTVTGTGEVRCPRGADVARGLLATMDLGEVPSACGRSQPLSGERVFPDAWRTAADNVWGLPIPVVTAPNDEQDAVQLLTEVIASSASPVTLLTLGPLTNVAEAIEARPELVENLSRVVVMGGAVGVPGNVQPDGATEPLAAEWNLYIDPEAAARVLGSGVRLTLVTLDATNQVPVTEDVTERLAANDVTEATWRVRRLFERYPPPFLWDPLAAIAVADPELVPSHEATVSVVTEGDESGRTVVDTEGTPILVADPPAADVVLDDLLRTLAGVPEDGELVTPTTVPVVGELEVGFDGTNCAYEGPTTLESGGYLIDLRPAPVRYWVALAHLTEGATLKQAMAWVAEHPQEEPPMIDEIVVVGEGAATSSEPVELRPGTVGIVCVTDDDSLFVAGDVTVQD